MGIEPTRSLFPDPSPVLKTGPGTSHGRVFPSHAHQNRATNIPNQMRRSYRLSYPTGLPNQKNTGQGMPEGKPRRSSRGVGQAFQPDIRRISATPITRAARAHLEKT